MTCPEFIEARARIAQTSKTLKQAGGFRRIEKRSTAGFEVFSGAYDDVRRDLIKFLRVGHGSGGMFRIDVFQNELGEVIRELGGIELRAEMKKSDCNITESLIAFAFPVACQG